MSQSNSGRCLRALDRTSAFEVASALEVAANGVKGSGTRDVMSTGEVIQTTSNGHPAEHSPEASDRRAALVSRDRAGSTGLARPSGPAVTRQMDRVSAIGRLERSVMAG